MNNKEISLLLMENMGNFRSLIKTINAQRYSKDKILTETQFFVLISLEKHRKIELKNLSKELVVSTSSLCILLNKLVEQDYVYREEDARDRRNTFYGITKKGEETINSEVHKFASIVSEKFDNINEEEIQKLVCSLSEITGIVKKLF
ncbi:MAG: MarR family transcriptional regulator [Romboutsia sp.]